MRIFICMLCLFATSASARTVSLTEILAYHGVIRDKTKTVEKWYERELHMRPIRFLVTNENGVLECSVTRNDVYLVDRPGQEQKQMVRATYQIFDSGCKGKATRITIKFRGPGAIETDEWLRKNFQTVYASYIEYITQLEREDVIDRNASRYITRW